MDFEALEKLFERAIRLRRRLGEKGGIGTQWSVKFDNGEIHKYTLGGVKSPEVVQDDIEGVFVWLWSLKDYVKGYLEENDKPSRWIESEVSADQHLSICADIANRSKHGKLDKGSRSGKYPKLGKLKYQIPGSAMSSISFGAFDVGINISNPKQVIFEMPVLSEDDQYLGDAFKYLDYSLKSWEKIVEKVDVAV